MQLKYHALYFPLCSTVAIAAVTPNPYVTESGIEITPFLGVSLEHNDNITNERESGNKISSMLLELQPSILVEAERGRNIYFSRYTLTTGDYFGSSDDNYLDHELALGGAWNINLRNNVSLDYELNYLHDERGSGISEGVGNSINGFNEPIEYLENQIEAKYVYGSGNARGRIEGTVAYYDKSYKNFRNVTQFRDYTENRYGAAFYYKVAPNTSLLFNIKHDDREYDTITPGQASLDNNATYYYIGAEWNITGKTTGTAKLGLQDKDFSDNNREDFSGTSWDIGIDWSPRKYSTLRLDTLQQAKDPEQAGDYIEETSYSISWNHFWRERLSTNLSYTNSDESYVGITREDDTDIWGIAAIYDIRRWISITLGWDYSDKTSSQDNIGYEQQIWYLTTTFTL